MIRRRDFWNINYEVEKAIKEAFLYAKEKHKNNDFYLLLSDAHYLISNLPNPFRINAGVYFSDKARLDILKEYVGNKYYLHPDDENTLYPENTSDFKFTLTIELMIYTHMWESKPYLKLLKNLALLCASTDYNWNIEIPKVGRTDFITDEIIAVFSSCNLDLATVLLNGFDPPLRNAFAHSEYNFSWNDPKIQFEDKSDPRGFREIEYDEWTKKFCFTYLLGIGLQVVMDKERKNVSGQKVDVKLRDTSGNKVNGTLIYDETKEILIQSA